MPRFKIAHLKEQGIDLLIVPLDKTFEHKPESDQCAAIDELQGRASAANLAGTVVPVWEDGLGRMKFIAPENYHPYFRSINLAFVYANLNRELYW